jgi:hypothetical protein
MTDTINIKKSRVRKTKNDVYFNEQQDIVNKLNNILNISATNNTFILDDLKNDIDKQNKILELENDVKKFFAYTRWAYFSQNVDNKYLSLMRSIYKNTGYDVSYKITSRNGKYIYIYYINKKPLG